MCVDEILEVAAERVHFPSVYGLLCVDTCSITEDCFSPHCSFQRLEPTHLGHVVRISSLV